MRIFFVDDIGVAGGNLIPLPLAYDIPASGDDILKDIKGIQVIRHRLSAHMVIFIWVCDARYVDGKYLVAGGQRRVIRIYHTLCVHVVLLRPNDNILPFLGNISRLLFIL